MCCMRQPGEALVTCCARAMSWCRPSAATKRPSACGLAMQMHSLAWVGGLAGMGLRGASSTVAVWAQGERQSFGICVKLGGGGTSSCTQCERCMPSNREVSNLGRWRIMSCAKTPQWVRVNGFFLRICSGNVSGMHAGAPVLMPSTLKHESAQICSCLYSSSSTC